METLFMAITWQFVVLLGMILAFAFAVLWLYRPEKNKKKVKESNSDNGSTDSKEERIGKLQDMLYKHLQTRIYLEKIDERGNKYKEYNEANDLLYIKTLTSAINELKAKVNYEAKETQGNASSV